MKTYLAAVALFAAVTQPVSAITFPTLTTIYVGSGVYDDSDAANLGQATSMHCSNVSGVAVQVRALVLRGDGSVAGSLTVPLAHGRTFTFTTHPTTIFDDLDGNLNTGFVQQGVVNIEATNSAVFCTAVNVDAGNFKPIYMSPLHLVRINGHPGAEE